MEPILVTTKTEGYELLDSGEGEKLERFGGVVLRRPDPQAIWLKTDRGDMWTKADAVFSRGLKSGKWETKKEIKDWVLELEGLKFSLDLLPSKHVGVFPEQSQQWKWLEQKIKENGEAVKPVKVLNLFGYTGGASLACARAGAEVCHVDASKFAVDLAFQNLKLSGLAEKPVRFIVDDVRKFVEKEIKRGNKYDVVIMDPPVYGKGAKKEVWKIEEDLQPLLKRIKEIISNDPVAILINGYSSIYSSIAYGRLLGNTTEDMGGKLAFGELSIEDSFQKLLPAGVYARWSK